MILQQEPKQKIEIHIKAEYDDDIAQDDYNDWLSGRDKYLKKGFSLQQAKYFNRFNEDMMQKAENNSIDCLWIKVYAEIDDYEEYEDSLGGCWVNGYKDLIEVIKWHNMIDNVKEQVIKALGHDNIQFEIIEDFD